jgi:molecular chaperone Hsp33
MKVTGPLEGLLVEATGSGGLRGYTNNKVMNDLDGKDKINTTDALGDGGIAQIIKSIPGKILNTAQLKVDPPTARTIAARFYNHSMQTPTAVEISVKANHNGVISAHGITVERMPDGDQEAFIHILEQFDQGKVAPLLEKDNVITIMTGLLKLSDAEERKTRELMFKCRCSKEKAEDIIQAVAAEELKELAEDGKPHTIICHMCGQDYTISADTIQKLINDKT